jgi:hypothetical protein
MGILYYAHQPQGPHPSILSHFAFEDDAALSVDNDHFERRTALARLAWPDETHHFVGQSARNVLVAHRLRGSQGFVPDRRGEPGAGLLHFRSLFQVWARLGKSSIFHPSDPPRKTRGAHLAPLTSYTASYMARLSQAI